MKLDVLEFVGWATCCPPNVLPAPKYVTPSVVGNKNTLGGYTSISNGGYTLSVCGFFQHFRVRSPPNVFLLPTKLLYVAHQNMSHHQFVAHQTSLRCPPNVLPAPKYVTPSVVGNKNTLNNYTSKYIKWRLHSISVWCCLFLGSKYLITYPPPADTHLTKT